jgi:hypothetical protein
MSEAHPLVVEAVQTAHRYFEYTNGILGLAAFNAGLACISTGNPKFYGWLSLVFTVVAWGAGLGVYKRRLRILTNLGHKLASPSSVWLALPVAFLGMLFLTLIALGGLNTNGLVH